MVQHKIMSISQAYVTKSCLSARDTSQIRCAMETAVLCAGAVAVHTKSFVFARFKPTPQSWTLPLGNEPSFCPGLCAGPLPPNTNGPALGSLLFVTVAGF